MKDMFDRSETRWYDYLPPIIVVPVSVVLMILVTIFLPQALRDKWDL